MAFKIAVMIKINTFQIAHGKINTSGKLVGSFDCRKRRSICWDDRDKITFTAGNVTAEFFSITCWDRFKFYVQACSDFIIIVPHNADQLSILNPGYGVHVVIVTNGKRFFVI